MTYSSACQRVSRLTRLPTLALPATAPTRGSENGPVSRATVSGAKTVSLSSATTTSPRAFSTPRLSAEALPPFALAKMRTRGFLANFSRSTSRVRSFEPSSTQTTSRTGGSCDSNESTVRAMTPSSL